MYENGKNAALTEKSLSKATINKLKTDPDFWEGFHCWRPKHQFNSTCVEDPTRNGGWFFNFSC